MRAGSVLLIESLILPTYRRQSSMLVLALVSCTREADRIHRNYVMNLWRLCLPGDFAAFGGGILKVGDAGLHGMVLEST